MKREMLAPRSPYSDRQVARAKALLTRCTVKGVARTMNIPEVVIAEWRIGKRRADVKPDLEFLRLIERLARDQVVP